MAQNPPLPPRTLRRLALADLPLAARLTYVGMWTLLADEDGVCISNPRAIKATLWPYDDRTARDVLEDVERICDAGLASDVDRDGERLLLLTFWPAPASIVSIVPTPRKRR